MGQQRGQVDTGHTAIKPALLIKIINITGSVGCKATSDLSVEQFSLTFFYWTSLDLTFPVIKNQFTITLKTVCLIVPPGGNNIEAAGYY